jgi:TPR repeat protein
MLLDCRFLRYLLPALLILATAAQVEAQNTKQPTNAAIAKLIKQAESGDATAQRKLGRAYEFGERVPKDKKEAVRWFSKAAE